MAIAYCNITSDLIRVYRNIRDYKALRTFTGFTLLSGNKYELPQTGYVAQVFEDDYLMGVGGSASTLLTTEFFYDSSIDVLYVRTSGDDNPTGYTIEGGPDWQALKTAARNDAQEMLEGLLKSVYPVPFQKILSPGTSYNSRD